MQERCPPNNELLALDPAMLAMILFIDSSDEFPASQLHQGARIALECKKLDDPNPTRLRKELLSRSDLISRLTGLAEKRHKNNERAPKNLEPRFVSGLAILVFGHANDFMVVPPDELEKFLLTYIPHDNPANFALMDQANALVEKHKPPPREFIKHGRLFRHITK